jgi:quercetin dioxygenase-like cupin family protein
MNCCASLTRSVLMAAMTLALVPICLAELKPAAGVLSPEPIGEPVNLKVEDIEWQRMTPELGENSPEIAILNVHPETQATHLMIRSPVAMHVPPHWHSSNETHTVISGTFIAQVEDGEIVELPQGSFNYIPSRMVHQAWLIPGEDGYMTVLITVDGGWDITWVEGPPTEQHIGVNAPNIDR